MSAHMNKKECPCPECARRRKNRQELIATVAIVGVLLICGLLFGCSATTIGPAPVHSTQASFDGDAQNSGIVDARPGGFLVTAHFRDRYNELVAQYGAEFAPPLKKDEGLRQISDTTWFIDAQRMVQFVRMNTWRKSGHAETK